MVDTTRTQRLDGYRQKGVRIIALVMLVTAAVLLTAGAAAAQTPINSCQTISLSGDYVVSSDLDGGGSDCIVINASDVKIENDGHVITNSTNTGAAAVNITSGVSNVELVDLIVEDSEHAIRADVDTNETTSGIRVENLTADVRGLSSPDEVVFVDLSTNSTIDGFDLLDSSVDSPGNSDALEIDGDSTDAEILDVRVSDNEFRVNDNDGIIIESDDENRTTVRNVRITDNLVNATDNDAIEFDGDADPVGVVEDVLVSGNTIRGSPSDGIDFDYDDFGFEGPVRNLMVKNNVINSATSDAIEFEPDEDGFVGEGITFKNNVIEGSALSTTVENNAVDSDTDDSVESEADEDDTVGGEVTVKNQVYLLGTVEDGFNLDIDADNQKLDLSVVGNEIRNFGEDAVDIDDLQMHGADSVQVEVRDNTVEGGSDGIEMDTDSGTGGPDGTLTVEGNDITVTDDAVDKDSGPVTGIEIHRNNLVGDDFGVDNDNTTVGTFLDATNNFWGASDGPGSSADPDAPFEDPVTSTLADGGGSNVTEGGTAGVSNVHFDPFASSPFGERECVNRRNLGRGQEGQECPRDRTIGRGGSREELDRESGRRSDTSRRDRGRRSRGR